MSLKTVRDAVWKRPALMQWSIQTRLSVLYTLSAFGMLLLATVFLQWVLTSNLETEDNQFLAEKVQVLRTLLHDHPNDEAALRQEVQWEGGTARTTQYYIRVQDASGLTLLETPGMSRQIRASFPSPSPASEDTGATAEWKSPGGRSYRLMAARATVGSVASPRILQVALDVSPDDALIADYRRKMALVLLGGIIFSAAAGLMTARKGLRPLSEITAAAGRVTATQLDERIGLTPWPKELTALAAAFDAMLDRLHESFTRLSHFSADLAHELRTPVNNLMGEAGVALAKPRTPEEYQRVLESSLEEYERLSRMIDGLLFLARAESAQAPTQPICLNAFQELEAVREFYEAEAEEQGVELVCQGEARVKADPMLFRRAISNLVSNALRYTPSGGRITLSACQSEGQYVEVTVMDTGCGIEPRHLSHLFQRFYRADPARLQDHCGHYQGTGLGLAIVNSIMDMHGGIVTLESQPGVGTTATLKFPQQATFPVKQS